MLKLKGDNKSFQINIQEHVYKPCNSLKFYTQYKVKQKGVHGWICRNSEYEINLESETNSYYDF